MTNGAFEQIFQMARDLARQKAMCAVGRCGLTTDDRDDVASQLVITFYLRFAKFDSNRASMRTFASRVMDKELGSILRHRMAGRRRHSQDAREGDVGEIAGHVCDAQPSAIERRQFWMDVERALAELSPVLLDTARALCMQTPSELSCLPGQSRTVVYRRMRRLKSALSAAGIGPDYFAPAGGIR